MKTRRPFLLLVATLVLSCALTACFNTKIPPTELTEVRSKIDKQLVQTLAGTWVSEKCTISITPRSNGEFSYKIATPPNSLAVFPWVKDGTGFVASIEGVALVFLNPTIQPDPDVINPQSVATGPSEKWGIFAIRLDDAKQTVDGTDLKGLEPETTYRAVINHIKTTAIRREFTFTRSR